ncbi:uncharacterized protein LOC143190703 isoform X2 [Rhynchophorus ferrugineus]|uniref:uncharacterized protein LOC143190703 isoform X2 n=1 Tax=Rhynchophorus ferrugineus TaxID=354439 RepID=UPI003FCED036
MDCNRHKKDIGRARSTLSVSGVDYYLNLPVSCPASPAVSTLTLTPGRIRNIDQDMEHLKASRQDNPFIQELSIDLDIDPMSLPEMHEHMIRSPPPVNWPRSPNFRAFQFPGDMDDTLQVEVNSTKEKSKSAELKPKHSSWDGQDTSPLKSFKALYYHDKFSLLTSSSLRSSAEDNIRLMGED